MKKIKKYELEIILLLLVILFLILFKNSIQNNVFVIDVKIHELVSNMQAPWLTKIMILVTNLGNYVFFMGFSLLLFLLLKNKRKALVIFTNIMIIGVINLLIKIIVQRPRPFGYNIIEEAGYSFPSGHSSGSMAFYGLLIYFCLKYIKSRSLRILSVTFLSLLIFTIGFSRIYLGVHYFSDVVAGFSLSLIYLLIFIKMINDRQMV